MNNINLFWWLVDYHCQKNLQNCLPYIDEGVMRHPNDRSKPVAEGRETNAYQGILIFKNSDTFLDRLVEDQLVDPEDIDEPVTINSLEDFFQFYDERGDEDGAFVYESEKKQIVRISKIKDPDINKIPLSKKVPVNFVYHDNHDEYGLERTLRRNVGTKTRLAIDITEKYPDVHAFQIKRSAYGKLGMGLVTHFNTKGLREDFFLLNKDNGIYRIYEPDEKVTKREIPTLNTYQPGLFDNQLPWTYLLEEYHLSG